MVFFSNLLQLTQFYESTTGRDCNQNQQNFCQVFFSVRLHLIFILFNWLLVRGNICKVLAARYRVIIEIN